MKNYKIIMFTGGGIAAPYILQDSKKAFEKLGCFVFDFPVTRPMLDIRPVIKALNPDFVISLDHSGIDEEIFKKEKLICFSWFVDNPLYFITEKNRSPFNIFLVTDKSYVPVLNKFGFNNTFYVPLATNVLRIRKSMRKKMHHKESKMITDADISFVGSLGKRHMEWKNERKSTFKTKVQEILEYCIKRKIQHPEETFEELFTSYDNRDILEKLDMQARGALEFKIDMETSAYFREKYLLALKDCTVSIYGDDEWKKILPENYNFGGRISYDDDVGALYKTAKVNLNVTRTQIQTGVNQRVLDIAAASSVFLTDYRKTTQEFFDCDISNMIYHNESELKEKTAYLLNNDK